jgi:hypothetical protein
VTIGSASQGVPPWTLLKFSAQDDPPRTPLTRRARSCRWLRRSSFASGREEDGKEEGGGGGGGEEKGERRWGEEEGGGGGGRPGQEKRRGGETSTQSLRGVQSRGQ